MPAHLVKDGQAKFFARKIWFSAEEKHKLNACHIEIFK